MSKYNRHSSIISRQSDANIDEDNWINKLDKNLNKVAVQPKAIDESMFEQINAIMNSRGKYNSVEAAVEDMKERSGLKAYLANKVSNEDGKNKKIASSTEETQSSSKEDKSSPAIFKKCPQIKKTFENYIRDSKGSLPVPAIIDRIRGIHEKDISDAKDWDEDNLMRFVSQLNLKEKQNIPDQYNIHSNLGEQDNQYDDNGTTSNEDAFFSLMPAKL